MSDSPKVVLVELPGSVGSYGARLIAKRAGAVPYIIDTLTPGCCDVLLVSVHFPEQVTALPKLFRCLGASPFRGARGRRPYIVVGGFGAANPEPWAAFADAIVLGDGEPYADALAAGGDPRTGDLDHVAGVYLPDDVPARPWGERVEMAPVVAAQSACLEGAVVLCRFAGSDHMETVELARGCPRRCAFCAVGHTKRYRELPRAIAETCHEGKRRLFCADIGSLSFFDEAPWLVTTAGGLSVGAALRHTDALDRLQLPTMGVEGWSERLRDLVGKPITGDDLQRVAAERLRFGKHIVLWYLIHSLPSSSAVDRLEFLRLLGDLPAGFTVRLSFTPYQKQPHTPLSYAAAYWSEEEAATAGRIRREHVTAAKKVVFLGKGETKHLVDTLAACGTRRVGDLFLQYGEAPLGWIPEKVLAAAAAFGNDLADICGEWPATAALPWGHVDFGMGDPRARFERAIAPKLEAVGWRSVAEKMGACMRSRRCAGRRRPRAERERGSARGAAANTA